jgi:alkanesulfonate monooxygenase SsuD/methylene tetrahydromethanopterin reductase-like flavin-dependent oxidoreductase (luciferase family)
LSNDEGTANMTLKFAIFDHIEGIAGTPMRQLFRDRIDMIKAADQGGFTSYHLAEHHGSDLCFAPNQEIFLAAAAEATEQIRLGPMVKILSLHHPLRVIEDICMLDQLTGGRVDYGVGRGIAAIEHFWFEGDWFASHERFEEALGLILTGLRTGWVEGKGKHYNFPEIEVMVSPYQKPNPPFWYPGNPVTAGKFGMNLLWPGPIPQEAYDLYVKTWNDNAGADIRCEVPGQQPCVGTVELLGISHDEATGKDVAARGTRGLMRRVAHVHTFDTLALDEFQAEAALNPLAHAARALLQPGGESIMPMLTERSGTPQQVAEHLQNFLDRGVSDTIVLQLPTGDMTFNEAMHSLELFITEVIPALQAPELKVPVPA